MPVIERFFIQPSAVSDRAVYVLDRTIPCECEGEHDPTPGHGDCGKVLHILSAGRDARAFVARLNRGDASYGNSSRVA